ncbi:DUF1232 domain-containing protein [Paenibacillus sp. XY044]|uniref:DUF1232 domain-containing protein n=1 Tax=Paenibacillus sp. XY044 TaxID=2026089 RepID=UPI000B9952CF|nr:DUF1232 domain-containing protein [Paenibacillus sp. XY044]OZB91750.1 hypothetical protein CJP46_27335 [Paenibacillus sp. XY044]
MVSGQNPASHAKLANIIKAALKQQSLSMRGLSALTGMDTATISRIVNGKQQARLEHLQHFALHLGIPMEVLLSAAGYPIDGSMQQKVAEQADTGTGSAGTMEQELLRVFDRLGLDMRDITERVRQELAKYEEYAETREGSELITDRFPEKLEQLQSAGFYIQQLNDLYARYHEPDVPANMKTVIGSGLLYFVLSADIIPDYSFPLGYIDDALAVRLVLERLKEMETSP